MAAATSGDIPLITTPAYCTEQEWRDKTGISITDESAAQFVIDLREAHEQVRRKCFHLVRERIIFKRSDLKVYLPVRWISDGNMSGTVDSSDIVIHELNSDGLGFDSVSNATYLASVNDFNNFITLTSDSSDLTRQLYVTYYALSKPLDEVIDDELKRAVISQVTLLVIERLRRGWSLKGSLGWTAGGVTVNKDISAYNSLYDAATKELAKYVSFLRPTIPRKARTGLGIYGPGYDTSVAYSSQVLAQTRIGRTLRW